MMREQKKMLLLLTRLRGCVGCCCRRRRPEPWLAPFRLLSSSSSGERASDGVTLTNLAPDEKIASSGSLSAATSSDTDLCSA
jgi:hypothetical protein